MTRYVRDAKGLQWAIEGPCIFCGWITSARVYENGYGWQGTKCPANGNGTHIFEDSFPPEVMAVIRESRGLA